MTLPKVLRNVIAAIFMFFVLLAIAVQFIFGKYPFKSNHNIILAIVIILVVGICLWVYMYLRKILKKKNLSKNKLKIFEILYLLIITIVSRTIFGMLFINHSLKLSELSILHSHLLEIVPSFNSWYRFIENVNTIFNNASLTVYFVNTILFIIMMLAFRKILKLIISSEVITTLSTILFIMYPKYIYYSLNINLEYVSATILLLAILLIISIIREVKIVNKNRKMYILYSILLGILILVSTYIKSNLGIWIMILIIINLFIDETDFVKIKVSKNKIKKANLADKAKMSKMKSIRIKKILLAVLVTFLTIFITSITYNLFAKIVLKKDYMFYKVCNYSRFFSVVNQQTSREEMINSNFEETLDKSTGKYNIGNTLNNIVELNRDGKYNNSSKLIKTITNSVSSNLTLAKRFENFSTKNMDIIKNDVNVKKSFYKKCKNTEALQSLMNIGNIEYKTIFIIVFLSEIIHFIIKRKKDALSVTIRLIIVLSTLEMLIYSNYSSSALLITILMQVMFIVNLTGIYYNRDDKIKLLNPSKFKY